MKPVVHTRIQNTNAATSTAKTDYVVIGWMLGMHLVALLSLISFSWTNFAVMVVLYFATGCLGVTLGFHRLLTHRALKTPKWLERVLTTLGVLAVQGGPIEWVGHHRMHHAFSDQGGDPHDATRGFWYSHMGWLFSIKSEYDDPKTLARFARDIAADPYYAWLDKTSVQMLVQGLLALALFAVGGWQMVVWGIALRLVAVYHVTWLVNSAAHMWGYKPHDSTDLARNNWFVALVAFGEGWHSNHHAHGDVAPAGYRWWEFDLTFLVIRVLVFLGWAQDIKMPPAQVRYDSLIWMPSAVIRREGSTTAETAA